MTPEEVEYNSREAKIGTVELFSVPIVCLHIDDKERLCLAQISNTLLRDFSYNEIHNRRVALGITCLQCTPVQLEILRRTGAMPVSSRRCGLITKREAERLVKSFLEEIPPPRLPDNFSFNVYHTCGWGCQGQFIPSRYNSSRAKCIKCAFCNAYFSPNKFIFHYHKSPTSTYRHPDAANFNSWRRHLLLTDPDPSEKLLHSWEDVKSMFNGGCRKKMSTCTTKIPSHTVKPFKMEQNYDSSSLSPIVRYEGTSAGSLKVPERAHPAFNLGQSGSGSIGSYGDMLRSFSMHYNPWWKPWYLHNNQVLPVENSNFMLPFNMQESRGDAYHHMDETKNRKQRSVTPPVELTTANTCAAEKKSAHAEGFNIASIIGNKKSDSSYDGWQYTIRSEDEVACDVRPCTANEKMERKRKGDNPHRMEIDNDRRSTSRGIDERIRAKSRKKASQVNMIS
ncbi:ski-like protein [Argopecten irradians]|uniref:ski-like protein n=1 Tax=Argopecten irradians TaxID=31199 RepID=UPI003713D54D